MLDFVGRLWLPLVTIMGLGLRASGGRGDYVSFELFCHNVT